MATASPFVSLSGIVKRFGEVTALDAVSLDVQEGETIALIGPSGSGKSTLLRCINGLETIQDGTITVAGNLIGMKPVNGAMQPLNGREIARQRESIGMVFQSFNLFPHMSAQDNVASGLIHVKNEPRARARARAAELLEQVGLKGKEKSYPRQLSGGQQQRVAIARALAMRPGVMLLDEPTSALDPETVQEVLNVVADLGRTGMTMLIATHEMEFARNVSTRTVFMEAGRIVEVGPSRAFFDNPASDRARRFLQGLTAS